MTIVYISCKCSDLFSMNAEDSGHVEGYVTPEIGIGGGDYLELEVELETGRIIGWQPDRVRAVLAATNEQ